MKLCHATVLSYDNQHLFCETKISVPPPPHAEFDTRGNLFLCGLKKSGLRWFEPVESLVVKPSAVTKIKTALQSM